MITRTASLCRKLLYFNAPSATAFFAASKLILLFDRAPRLLDFRV
jgi:hypothetical protein